MSGEVVRRITAYPFEIELAAPFRIATMVNSVAKGVLVKVETSGGVVGWGECMPFHAINGETQRTCVAALQDIGFLAIGKPVAAARQVGAELVKHLPNQATAASGLEMAMCDAASQAAGLSMVQWFGGSARSLPTDLTIAIVDPAEAAERAAAFVAAGHRHIKVKLGASVAADEARVAAVRAQIGDDATIRVDANQGYEKTEALRLLEAISTDDIEFCEQPVRAADRDGLAWLHGRSPVPVMADESCFSPHDALQLLALRCCSLLNVKVGKSGGLWRAAQIADIASAGYGACMMGGMAETRIGVTAAAHVAASRTVFKYFDLDAHVNHKVDPVLGGISFDSGSVVLPDGPGLGASPDPAWLKQLSAIELT